jgi:hypothetical protein
MYLKASNAIEALVHNGGLRDGILRAVSLQEPDDSGVLVIEMKVSAPLWSDVAAIRLRLTDVTFFALNVEWRGAPMKSIECYKVFLTESGCYLSLDPWDEFSRVRDERDGFVVEAKTLEVEVEKRSSATS